MAHFARTSSGLRREFRALDVFIFNILAYAIGVSLIITPPLLGGLYPQANLWIVLSLGLLLAICNGLTYGLFSAIMPRSGGDYVFISRSLHPWVGFTASFGFVVSQVLGIGLYTSLFLRDAVGTSAAALSLQTGMDLKSFAAALATPGWNIAGGLVVLAIVYGVTVRGMSFLRRFLDTLFWIAMASTVMMGVLVLRTDHAEFVSRFNAFMIQNAGIQNAYNMILHDAAASGFVLGRGWTWTASVLALPIAYLAFAGFTYSVYVGGEVRSPERSQVRGILGSLLVGSVVYFIVLGRYYAIAGQDFINALALLNAQGKSPVPLGGSLLLQATMLTDDTPLQFLICIGFALWFFLLLFVMTQACVRVVFAWAMDRLAPFALTKVTVKAAAPSVATAVTLAVSAVGLILNALGLLTFLNYIALFSVCFLIGGIAAVVFPSRNRRLFERAPASARAMIFGRVSVLRAAGVGNTILFTIVLLSALLHPGISGVSGWKPWLFLAVVYSAGFIWYRVATTRSDAVDPRILYEELPPDVEESTTSSKPVHPGAAQA